MNASQFRQLIIKPTLAYLGETQTAMENLLVGTALQESGLESLRQMGNGPALGLFQVEPATHQDQWLNWLTYRKDYADKVRGLAAHRYWTQAIPDDSELIVNMAYECAIAWCKYHRAPEALPMPENIAGLAAYYKTYYNGNGKATVGEFINNYERALT